MKYTEKIKHAEIVAKDLLNEKTLNQVNIDLKEKGLYENDISNVIASARNIIGEQLKPIIRAKLLAKEDIKNAKEFEKLDAFTLDKLVNQEIKSISAGERKKVKELLNNGTDPKDIFTQIRQDFYPKENILHQIAVFQEVQKENSGSGRMLKILGGLALMIVGGGISYASMQSGSGGRLFYGLIGVGFIIMIQGFMTVEDPY